MFAAPDMTYNCTHCETECDDYYGTLGIHIDLGYGDVYTVCTACAKNLAD